MTFLESMGHDFRKLKAQADKAIVQVTDEDLHWQPDPESNSIAILMKHLAGNMLSRWTDFLTTDGEKPNRNRDGEFVDDIHTRTDLTAIWERGWASAFHAIEALTPADLDKTVTIRGEAHSVPLALVRQHSHYAGHVGQIVYVAKHRAGSKWNTLSVPRKRTVQ